MSVVFATVQAPSQVEQILALQAINHRSTVDPITAARDGFTTVRHDPAVLQEMNRQYPSAIACSGDSLAGYCLMMPQSFRRQVPILEPMFEKLEGMSWRGVPIKANPRWFVMGQVCVADGFRGQGVFDGMYAKLRDTYRHEYDFVVTEVSSANQRSLRAHWRVGFETMLVYSEADSVDHWELVVWDWR